MVTKKQTQEMLNTIQESTPLKIFGNSVGDRSVGMFEIPFEINLGLYPEDVSEEDRKFIVETIIRSIWELHDNGDIKFEFSDEWDKLNEEDKWDYRRRFTWKDSQRLLEMKNDMR